MRNVLITGLTGRSGRYFGELLLQECVPGICVTAVVRDLQKAEALFGRQRAIALVEGNIADRKRMEKLLYERQIDTLFHIAGIGFSTGLVQAAAGAKTVRRLILVHTSGIYSKYKSAAEGYLQIEREVRAIAQSAGMVLTILRPTMLYGSADDRNISVFAHWIQRLPVFPLVGGGAFALQPVHHRDLGRAYYLVLTHEVQTRGKEYVLSGGNAVELRALLSMITELLEKRTAFVNFPYPLAMFAAVVLFYASGKKADYREKVQRLVEPRAYSHADATRDFGYTPMPLQKGLAMEIEILVDK